MAAGVTSSRPLPDDGDAGPGSVAAAAAAAVAGDGSAAVIGSRGPDGTARAADGRAPYVPSFTAVPTNRYGRTTADLKTKRNHCGPNTTIPVRICYYIFIT